MTLRTLNYGNYGIFLIMGNAGFCPSTVSMIWVGALGLGFWFVALGFGFGGFRGNFGIGFFGHFHV